MSMAGSFLEAMERRPLLSVVSGSLLISFSAVFVKLVSVGPDVAAFYRCLFGGAGLLLLSLLLGESWRVSRRTLLLGVAAVSLAADLGAWHRSIALVGPGLATICINFQVFLVALWGWAVYRDALPPRLFLGMVMALAGLWLLAGVDLAADAASLRGVLWGLAAAAAFAAYILSVRASQSGPSRLPPVSNMALASLATAVLLGGFCLARGESLAITTPADGGLLLGYGLISQGAGWLLLSIGLPGVTASVGGLSILIMPTFSFIWDILFFQRQTGFWGACGAVLAIAAIRLGVGRRRTKNASQQGARRRGDAPLSGGANETRSLSR